MAGGLDFRKILQVESGGRQKNPDGTTVRSNKGAVGIAQIMPKTGPEAAQLAGVKWDPRRFENDAGYNRQLGQAYFKAQVRRFGGDETAAVAAYNAGPTRVAKLQAEHGANWQRHLPAETKGYISKVTGQTPMRTFDPGASSVPSANLDEMAGSLFDPFGAAPRVKQASDAVITQGEQALQTLESVQGQLNQVNEERQMKLAETVAAKDAIYKDIGAQTQELKDRLAPIFAQRAELSKRRQELVEMNPIKREFLSIFNRNYSKEHIEEQDQALVAESQLLGQEYEITNKLSETMMGVITGQHTGQEAINQLRIEDITNDATFSQQSLSLTRQIFGDAVSAMEAGTAVTRAQILARGDVLSKMTMADLNSAYAEAKKNGGSATIAGVPLSMAEIQDQQQRQQNQELALEGQKLGLQSQRLNYAQAREQDVIRHMSASEIQQAINNGGMFKGVKLDQQALTQAYGGTLQRQEYMANAAGNNVDAGTYRSLIDSYNGQFQETIRRMTGLTGSRVPSQFRQFNQGMVQFAAQARQKILSAPEEARPRMRAEFIKQIGSMMEQQDKVIDKVAQGMTRDPDGQILLGAWMKGDTVTPEQATKGIIALGRAGALPPGVRLQGAAAKAVKAGIDASLMVDRLYDPTTKENAARVARGQFKKPNAKALEAERMQKVSQAVSQAWVQGNMTELMNRLPEAAKNMGHPFGNVSMSDFRAAQAAGDQAGMTRLGQVLGLDADQMQKVFGPGGSKALPSDSKMTFSQAQQQLQKYQGVETLRALDRSPSAQGMKVKPSEAMVDFMGSQPMQSRLADFTNVVGKSSFGAMIGDAIGGGNVVSAFNQYGNVLGRAHGAIVLEDQASQRAQIASYKGTPFKRAAAIAGAIPGLDATAEKMLIKGIREQLGVSGLNETLAQLPVVGSGTGPLNEAIDNLILHGKFDNPSLEKIRRVAAQNWVQFSESTDRAMDRLNSTDEQ